MCLATPEFCRVIFPNPGRHMHNMAIQTDAATSAPNFGFTSSHYKKQLMSCCGGGAGLMQEVRLHRSADPFCPLLSKNKFSKPFLGLMEAS